MSNSHASIEGDWTAQKQACNCGYHSTWTVALEGDHAIVEERWGSYCLGCIPNCVPKRGVFAHRMTKVDDRWEGKLCCKPIRLTAVSDTELGFLTTEGPMKMTRE